MEEPQDPYAARLRFLDAMAERRDYTDKMLMYYDGIEMLPLFHTMRLAIATTIDQTRHAYQVASEMEGQEAAAGAKHGRQALLLRRCRLAEARIVREQLGPVLVAYRRHLADRGGPPQWSGIPNSKQRDPDAALDLLVRNLWVDRDAAREWVGLAGAPNATVPLASMMSAFSLTQYESAWLDHEGWETYGGRDEPEDGGESDSEAQQASSAQETDTDGSDDSTDPGSEAVHVSDLSDDDE